MAEPPSHFRAQARRKVGFVASLASAQDSSDVKVRVVDIGLGGARIEPRTNVFVGDRVVLTVTVPEFWEPLVLTARVAWTSRDATGVMFLHEEDAGLGKVFEILVNR